MPGFCSFIVDAFELEALAIATAVRSAVAFDLHRV